MYKQTAMVKKLIFFFIIFFFVKSVESQIYTKVNLNNNYIVDKTLLSGYGAGYNIAIGYLINSKLKADFNFESSIYTFKYLSGDNYKVNSVYLNFIYKIFRTNKINTSIGFGSGFFQKKTNIQIVDWNNPQPFYLIVDYTEKGIGIIPSIGFEFKHPSIQNLNWDIGFSYQRIFTEHPINLLQLKIGLLYYFNKKTS